MVTPDNIIIRLNICAISIQMAFVIYSSNVRGGLWFSFSNVKLYVKLILHFNTYIYIDVFFSNNLNRNRCYDSKQNFTSTVMD